jgi:hypothetical protein
MLWRMRCEDGCGRTVESLLIPLLVDLTRVPSPWTAECVDDLRQAVEGFICVGADMPGRPGENGDSKGGGDVHVGPADAAADSPTAAAAAARWRTLAERSNHAFFSTRLARERAIQAYTTPLPILDVQPGLFDRRAERARLAAMAARSEAESEHRNRVAALELSMATSITVPELLLVLLP